MMNDILILVIAFLELVLVLRTLIIFYKNPLDFGAIFQLLFLVFFVPAFWNYTFDLNLFVYEFFNYYEVFPTQEEVLYYHITTLIIMWAFEFGYSMQRYTKVKVSDRTETSKLKGQIVQIILFSIWTGITLYGFSGYNGNLIMFFSPARKTIYTSGYLISIVVIIPATLIYLNRFVRQSSKTTSTILLIVYSFALILTQMSLGQRREIINGLVYIVLILMLSSKKLVSSSSSFKINRTMKRRVVFLGLFVAALIPILWYARTYSTQLQRGGDIIMPWQIRGWFELLFGSSTTGFETSFIVSDFTEQYGSFTLHSVIFMATIFIPRAIFPNKYMSITKTMQFTFGIEGNMSIFFVNEIFFNFSYFGFIVSFLFGYYISKFYNKRIRSNQINQSVYAIVLLSQVILLFKNGFAQYIIMIVLYFISLYSVTFIVKNTKKET